MFLRDVGGGRYGFTWLLIAVMVRLEKVRSQSEADPFGALVPIIDRSVDMFEPGVVIGCSNRT